MELSLEPVLPWLKHEYKLEDFKKSIYNYITTKIDDNTLLMKKTTLANKNMWCDQQNESEPNDSIFMGFPLNVALKMPKTSIWKT